MGRLTCNRDRDERPSQVVVKVLCTGRRRRATAAAVLLAAAGFTVSADDHDEVRELRQTGDIVPLSALLQNADLSGYRVLEVELEHERGRLVYELELLDQHGRVHERYFDAATGQPLSGD